MNISADADEWVRANLVQLHALAYHLTGDRDQAQDLTQEALARVLDKWAHVNQSANPRAYGRRVLVNVFMSSRRKRRLLTTSYDEHPTVLNSNPTAGHEDGAVDRDYVLSIMRCLPHKQRAALVLRFLEGYDDAAIAGLLGCSESAVRSSIHTGLKRLRERNGTPQAKETADV